MIKWRTKIRDELALNKPKKVDVAEVPEGAIVDAAKLKEVTDKTESDLENQEDQELEDQIKDALHSEKKQEKKLESFLIFGSFLF